MKVFSCVKLMELYEKLDTMPWMFLNVLKSIDHKMKPKFRLKSLKTSPKRPITLTYLLTIPNTKKVDLK